MGGCLPIIQYVENLQLDTMSYSDAACSQIFLFSPPPYFPLIKPPI
ncbi:hypothetical protein Kkor_1298 [Kangiella koreensis DSM 16069]|uniref:Uncharacterized protein n=1 Tax=Kangiella koreensis (strain DSM 16069 / JCM 12317 / KCTC 12182 / SW-125) TaxID=523791 RepID=C7RBS2_KANKD|nr:hypothetical protein Kkor_1298 [Kangiella koreensis DSM 16069]